MRQEIVDILLRIADRKKIKLRMPPINGSDNDFMLWFNECMLKLGYKTNVISKPDISLMLHIARFIRSTK